MTIKGIFNLLWKEFIYGGHLQSLGGVSIVFVSAILLEIKISWDILFASYVLLYPIYLYNRYKEIKTDYSTNPERTEYLKNYVGRGALFLIATSFILLVWLLVYFSNLRAIIFTILLLALGFLYTDIFKKLTRKIFFLKNFYVALSFALLVFFPIIYYSLSSPASLTWRALVISVFVFLNAFLMQVFLDLKDLESDRENGLLTIPVTIGRENAVMVIKIFSFLVDILIPVAIVLCLPAFHKSILFFILIVPFNFYCLKLSEKQNYLGYVLMGGVFILWPFLVLLGENVENIW